MDALHLKKIDLSDEIFVVNFNDYIGDSTRREVEYAMSINMPVRWFTHDKIGDAVKEILKQATEQETVRQTCLNNLKSIAPLELRLN